MFHVKRGLVKKYDGGAPVLGRLRVVRLKRFSQKTYSGRGWAASEARAAASPLASPFEQSSRSPEFESSSPCETQAILVLELRFCLTSIEIKNYGYKYNWAIKFCTDITFLVVVEADFFKSKLFMLWEFFFFCSRYNFIAI